MSQLSYSSIMYALIICGKSLKWLSMIGNHNENNASFLFFVVPSTCFPTSHEENVYSFFISKAVFLQSFLFFTILTNN